MSAPLGKWEILGISDGGNKNWWAIRVVSPTGTPKTAYKRKADFADELSIYLHYAKLNDWHEDQLETTWFNKEQDNGTDT